MPNFWIAPWWIRKVSLVRRRPGFWTNFPAIKCTFPPRKNKNASYFNMRLQFCLLGKDLNKKSKINIFGGCRTHVLLSWLLSWLTTPVHVQIITEKGAKFSRNMKLLSCESRHEWKLTAKTLTEPCRVPTVGLEIMTDLNFIN